MRIQWEYYTANTHNIDGDAATFASLGEDGWELVSVSQGLAYFKRRLEPVAPVMPTARAYMPAQEMSITSAGPNKIAVVKTLRQLLCVGLVEAKGMIDTLPFRLSATACPGSLDVLVERLREVGAVVEVWP